MANVHIKLGRLWFSPCTSPDLLKLHCNFALERCGRRFLRLHFGVAQEASGCASGITAQHLIRQLLERPKPHRIFRLQGAPDRHVNLVSKMTVPWCPIITPSNAPKLPSSTSFLLSILTFFTSHIELPGLCPVHLSIMSLI